MKNCPYCAEEIQDAAVVCRFCRRELVAGAATPSAPLRVEIAEKGARKNLTQIGTLLLVVGLLAVGLLYACNKVLSP